MAILAGPSGLHEGTACCGMACSVAMILGLTASLALGGLKHGFLVALRPWWYDLLPRPTCACPRPLPQADCFRFPICGFAVTPLPQPQPRTPGRSRNSTPALVATLLVPRPTCACPVPRAPAPPREGKFHRFRDGMLYDDEPEYYDSPGLKFLTADIDVSRAAGVRVGVVRCEVPEQRCRNCTGDLESMGCSCVKSMRSTQSALAGHSVHTCRVVRISASGACHVSGCWPSRTLPPAAPWSWPAPPSRRRMPPKASTRGARPRT